MNFIFESIINHPAISWAVLGVVMAIVEVLTPGGFFVPFAAAGVIVAAATAIGVMPESLLWQAVIFLALGLALIPVCRRLLRRYSDTTPDINKF